MLGKLIKDIRITYGISPEQLADGLCSPGMLKKYERGQTKLEKLLGDALLQRLGKSMMKYDTILDEDEYRLAVMRSYIQELLRSGDVSAAEQQLFLYENLEGTKRPLHQQFCKFCRVEIDRQTDKPLLEQEQTVLSGLQKTISVSRLTPGLMRERRFCMLELLLLERYAILQEQKGKIEMAEQWYVEILAYLDQKGEGYIEYDLADKYQIYPIIAYRLAGIYTEQARYDEALQLLETGSKLLGEIFEQAELFIRIQERKKGIYQKLKLTFSKWDSNCLRAMKEIKKMYSTGKGCFYPMYKEQYVHSINEMVRERRISRDWSEEELAGEVCDVRTIQRIESGKEVPQKGTRGIILERFGLSERRYDGAIITGCYEDYKIYADMMKMDYEGDCAGAKEAYQKLVKRLDIDYITNLQFVCYWGIVFAKREGRINDEQMKQQLWELLEDTLPGDNLQTKGNCTLLYHERRILMSLAWDVQGEYSEKVKEILKVQMQRLEKEKGLKSIYSDYYIGIIYCLARIAKNERKLEIAEHYIERGLKSIFIIGRFARWERILFMKFQIEEKKYGTDNPSHEVNNDLLQWAGYAYVVATYYRRDNMIGRFFINYLNRIYEYNIEEKLRE